MVVVGRVRGRGSWARFESLLSLGVCTALWYGLGGGIQVMKRGTFWR